MKKGRKKKESRERARLLTLIADALRDEKSTDAMACRESKPPEPDDVGLTQDEIVGAIVELSGTLKAQGDAITKMRRREARREVDGYIGTGRLLPKSRGEAVRLVMSGDRKALKAFLAPASAPYIRLTAPVRDDAWYDDFATDVDAEILRLTAVNEDLLRSECARQHIRGMPGRLTLEAPE